MADTGEKTTGTVEATGSWSNCTTTRLNSSDNSRTTVSWAATPNTFRVSDFNFGIPAGATIDGIEVIIERSTDNASYAMRTDARLSWNDGTSWTSYKNGSNYSSTTDADETLGGSTDTWGRTWAQSEFADGTFQAEIRGNSIGTFANPRVDYLRIKVYYTAGPQPNVSESVSVAESVVPLVESQVSPGGGTGANVLPGHVIGVDVYTPN